MLTIVHTDTQRSDLLHRRQCDCAAAHGGLVQEGQAQRKATAVSIVAQCSAVEGHIWRNHNLHTDALRFGARCLTLAMRRAQFDGWNICG